MDEPCASCGKSDGVVVEQKRATRTVNLCVACAVGAPAKNGLTAAQLTSIADRAAKMIRGGEGKGIFRINHKLAEDVRNDVPELEVAIKRLWLALAALAKDGIISQGRAAELAGLTASEWRNVINHITDQQL